MKITYRPLIAIAIWGLLPILNATSVYAQLNPLSAAYFQNQYLANPAMAGFNEGLKIDLSYRKQWSSIPGAPQSQALTSDFGSDKVGVGLTVYNDRAGLQRVTRVTGTYAYHLLLNKNNSKLHFGLSLGRVSQVINQQDVNGNAADVLIGDYNRREAYLDGDFGIAYSTGNLVVQGALPNLKRVFKKDENSGTADRSSFFAAASYNLQVGNGLNAINITPKACFRGVTDWDNIVDIGANVALANNQLFFMGMYHTTESASFGLGMQYRTLKISGVYTTETSALRGVNGGDFEINLSLNLFGKP